MIKERPGVAAALILAAALSLTIAPVQASQHKRNQNDTESAAQISPDQAAAAARSATGGRVLSVRLSGKTYRVRVLLEGERVSNVRVDARTGQVLN